MTAKWCRASSMWNEHVELTYSSAADSSPLQVRPYVPLLPDWKPR